VGDGTQVSNSTIRSDSVPAVRLLNPEMPPRAGRVAKSFQLSGDTTGALAEYKWTYVRTAKRNVSIGISAFNLKVTLNASTYLSDKIELTYELRGGYDYSMRRIAEADGLLWASARSGAASA
jgi:hypothetical protein